MKKKSDFVDTFSPNGTKNEEVPQEWVRAGCDCVANLPANKVSGSRRKDLLNVFLASDSSHILFRPEQSCDPLETRLDGRDKPADKAGTRQVLMKLCGNVLAAVDGAKKA